MRLWLAARFYWWDQYGKGADERCQPPFEGEDRIVPAMALVWRNAIDRGIAQPVTTFGNVKATTPPDAPWCGLGLAPVDEGDRDAWGYVLYWLGGGRTDVADLCEQKRHLERRWVEREVAKQVSEIVAAHFDEDGDFLYYDFYGDENDREEDFRVPTPHHLFREVIFKVDEAAQEAVDHFEP